MFQRADATRILVFTGILLLVLNMLLAEVFAIFISHVANSEIREHWIDIVAALKVGDIESMRGSFDRVEFLLERRARIINTHSHLGAFGVLLLSLALLQGLLPFSNKARRRIAITLATGAFVQPVFVFASPYTGIWANWVSDLGALLILLGLGATGIGLLKSTLQAGEFADKMSGLLRPDSSGILLRYGSVLILIGMLFGFYYAWVFVTQHEPQQFELIDQALASSVTGATTDAAQVARDYRTIQSRIAITTAVHSHAIEMGTLAILLAFIQSFVFFSERWKVRWAWTFVIGSFCMPFFIFNATIFGLVSAAFADLSGGVILFALIAMLIGSVRYTGAMDSEQQADGAPS